MSDKQGHAEAERLEHEGIALAMQAMIKRNAKLANEILTKPEQYKLWIDELIGLQVMAEEQLAEYTALPPLKGGDWMERHIGVVVWTKMRDFYKSFGIDIPEKWLQNERDLKEKSHEIARSKDRKPEDSYVDDEEEGIEELG